MLTAPRVRDQLNAIVGRGGRVIVVDPRRTETARAYEHVAVRPDGDAWLLLSLLHVLFDEDLADEEALARATTGAGALRAAAARHPPEATEERTGVPAEDVRALARDLAAAPSAAVYGRTGSCLGRFGTLVAHLIDALNAVTGNLDRPGGAVFGRPAVALDDVAEQTGLDTYGAERSRFGDFPDVIGAMPAALMPREITTPGERQVRAFFVSAGNPVLSVPDGDALEAALEQVELMVSLDLYVNETNRHADYVLPATTWLEREDVPLAFLGFYTTPFVQYSDPVVAPAGEARDEWQIIDAIARRIGVAPYSEKRLRRLGELGLRLKPKQILDLLLRSGPGRLSIRALKRHPHGLVTSAHIATGVLREKVRHRDGRVHLDPPAIVAELRRLDAAGHEDDPERPLRLIGLRELRSHNSWMHNAKLLMRGGRTHALRVHPDDAEAHRPGRRRHRARGQQVRRRRGAGAGDRRHDPGHGRAAARLGPSRRLVAGQRGRRRERQPALVRRARGPRAPGRHGLPERDPGQPRAGRVRGARTVSPSRRRASSIAAVSGVVPVRSASSKISLSVSRMPRTRARARLGS